MSTDPQSSDGKTRASFALALALLAIAGWVDGVGYLQLGHLFLSFMSGNTTQMAVELGRGHWSAAGDIGILVGLFVLGVFLGTLAALAAGRWHLSVVLGLEAGLLVLALVLPTEPAALPLAALPVVLAMGLQNAALVRLGTRNASLTYVTGTLVNLGRELAQAVSGQGDRRAWLDSLALWLTMAVGAVLGALAFAWLGYYALALPAVAAATLAVALAIKPEK